MKSIKTKQGDEILLDDEDYEELSRLIEKRGIRLYTLKQRGHKSFHIMGTISNFVFGKVEKGFVIDHKDGNTSNNNKNNLRTATYSENNRNQKSRKGKKNKYKGVTPRGNAYRASIYMNGKLQYKKFQTPIEGALWYNEMAKKYFGEFARLNEIVDEQLELWKDK